MYMMSRDRLTLELDESSLELILQVLSSEALTTEEDSRTLKEYETIQQKIHSVFDGFHQNGKVQRTDMLITDITVDLESSVISRYADLSWLLDSALFCFYLNLSIVLR